MSILLTNAVSRLDTVLTSEDAESTDFLPRRNTSADPCVDRCAMSSTSRALLVSPCRLVSRGTSMIVHIHLHQFGVQGFFRRSNLLRIIKKTQYNLLNVFNLSTAIFINEKAQEFRNANIRRDIEYLTNNMSNEQLCIFVKI